MNKRAPGRPSTRLALGLALVACLVASAPAPASAVPENFLTDFLFSGNTFGFLNQLSTPQSYLSGLIPTESSSQLEEVGKPT